jgi:TonB family protein
MNFRLGLALLIAQLGFSAHVASATPATIPLPSGAPHQCAGLAVPDQREVLIGFKVTSRGTVGEARIVRSSSNGTIDSMALKCVQSWHYEPATEDGQPTSAWRRVLIARRIVEGPPTWSALPHTCSNGYPADALEQGVQGAVLLSFVITTEGLVDSPKVERSSGNQQLDQAAIQCVSGWTYIPATYAGQPMATPWRATVNFRDDRQTSEKSTFVSHSSSDHMQTAAPSHS